MGKFVLCCFEICKHQNNMHCAENKLLNKLLGQRFFFFFCKTEEEGQAVRHEKSIVGGRGGGGGGNKFCAAKECQYHNNDVISVCNV
jgi:hypothetical protein